MRCGLPLKQTEKIMHNSPTAATEGNVYVYTVLKRHSYLFAAFAIGKWTQQTCGQVLCDFCSKVTTPQKGEKLEVFTDGNDDYVCMLPRYFDVEDLNYGQLVKLRDD